MSAPEQTSLGTLEVDGEEFVEALIRLDDALRHIFAVITPEPKKQGSEQLSLPGFIDSDT